MSDYDSPWKQALDRYFRPFLALHEFEAWLFSSREELSRTMTQPAKAAAIAAIRDAFPTPEDIDEGLNADRGVDDDVLRALQVARAARVGTEVQNHLRGRRE